MSIADVQRIVTDHPEVIEHITLSLDDLISPEDREHIDRITPPTISVEGNEFDVIYQQ